MACGDDEPRVSLRRHRAACDPFDHREWWGFPLKGSQEPVDIVPLTLCLDEHPLAIVRHAATYAETRRQGVHTRTKAHSLDHALNPNLKPCSHDKSRSCLIYRLLVHGITTGTALANLGFPHGTIV